MSFYIYNHLDKAKIATLARLKASSDVIKHDKSCCLNIERKYYHDDAEKIMEVLGRKTGCFFVDWQPCKTTKRTHITTFA